MEKLFTLLDILVGLRQQKSREELAFFAVNETHKLVQNDLAVFWTYEYSHIKFVKTSGGQDLDPLSPLGEEIKNKIKEMTASPDCVLPEYQNLYYSEEEKNIFALILLKDQRDQGQAGLLLKRKSKFNEAELNLLAELGQAYNYTYSYLSKSTHKSGSIVKNNQKATLLLAGAAAVIFLLWPIRLSLTAPAEIVAENAQTITAPFDGTIETVDVSPGQEVDTNQRLLEMDATELRSRLRLAKQTLEVIRENLSVMRRSMLSDPDKRGKIGMLEAEIKTQKIEADFARELLDKTQITAPREGIVVFSDKNNLIGRPVQTGDQLMLLADPQAQELLIRVPVNALIPVEKGASLTFYMNVAPLKEYTAEVKSVGYQASRDPDGLLSYKIRAKLPEDKEQKLRIGWKGRASIQGEWSVMGYAIMRKPLIYIRELAGI